MKKELICANELLAINELPLREKDFIECQKALFGKTSAFLYTVVVVCCVSMFGVYGIAKEMSVLDIPTGILFIPLICLQIASFFYFALPNWLGKLRYLQYETSNSKPNSVAFYTDHFEILIDDIKVGIYSYVSVRRIIKSENLFIMVLSNMVYLPVRFVGIPDERWPVIEQHIAAAIHTHR